MRICAVTVVSYQSEFAKSQSRPPKMLDKRCYSRGSHESFSSVKTRKLRKQPSHLFRELRKNTRKRGLGQAVVGASSRDRLLVVYGPKN